MTTTAAAPSEIWEEEPAVTVPSLLNAGRSLPSDSIVVSPRTPSSVANTTGSPLRCGISTGTTSSSKTPFFHATAAFWWDCAANSSCSSRVRLCAAALHSSVSRPIACCVAWSYSASYAIESTSFTSPNLMPSRDFGKKCGALVIDSMPPATTTSTSPARISWSAIAIALRPERHTLLIVIDGTFIGMPPLMAAVRAGFCPAPAWMTWPMIT